MKNNDELTGPYTYDEKIDIVKSMILAIGENPAREGLIDTPKRVVKMWDELFRGYKEEPPVLTTFNNGNDGIIYNQMINDRGKFYSFCEHHMLPFKGQYFFAFLPHEKGKLIGLSKVARVVDYYSARLQIQERLTHQIVNHIWNTLCNESCKYPPIGMGLVMEAEHLCKTMRGVKKEGTMRTTVLRGKFLEDQKVKQEFLDWVNKNG